MKATAAASAARLSRSTGGLGLGWVVGVVSLPSWATLSPVGGTGVAADHEGGGDPQRDGQGAAGGEEADVDWTHC